VGEWKVQVSVRVSQVFREEIERHAALEKRSMGNFVAVILEWGFEQFKTAGSTERLLKAHIERSVHNARGKT
jgi:hypothetical protein